MNLGELGKIFHVDADHGSRKPVNRDKPVVIANSHAPMSLFRVINHGKERVSSCLLRSKTAASLAGYSTSAKAVVEKIFADSKSAEFVAAASSVTSIPKLHDLPEVC